LQTLLIFHRINDDGLFSVVSDEEFEIRLRLT